MRKKLVRMNNWRDRCVFTVVCLCRQHTEDGDRNGSEEEDDEKPGRRVMGPRKKFVWDDKLRWKSDVSSHRSRMWWSWDRPSVNAWCVCVCAGHCCVIWCGWSWAVTSWRVRVHSHPRITSRSSWRPRSNRCGPKAGCRPGGFRHQRLVNDVDSLNFISFSLCFSGCCLKRAEWLTIISQETREFLLSGGSGYF